jgi:hypothetical protein
MKSDQASDMLRPAVEASLGQQIALRLKEGERNITPAQAERLKALRMMALERARAARAETAPAAMQQGRVLALGGPARWKPWIFRAASIVPLLVLVAGLAALQHYQQEKFVHATADIDTALLLDELPPAAYADPGFAHYLRQDR